MTSICNPVDDLITQAADLLNATLSLVHNRLAPPPKQDTTARLMNVSRALQDTVGQFQTSSFKCKLEAEISALKQETQRFTESVETQLREWEQQQEEQLANETFHTESSGLFPVDVIGVIATFLPTTTDAQRPLMLVNHAWLQGVASQNNMKPEPEVMWPYTALRLRDPAVLCLASGEDRHVAELARELPRLKAVQLYAPPLARGGPSKTQNRLSDESLRHIGKLKLLTTLRLNGLSCGSQFPSDAGMKHLANLRQLTSLSVAHCSNVTQLGLENFENLTSLDIRSGDQIPESVLDTSRDALRQLTTLKLSCEFTHTNANHLKALTTLTDLDLEGNLYGTPMMEAIGELSRLVELKIRSTGRQSAPSKGFSSLTKLKCLRFLSATDLDANDLETVCNGTPTFTSLSISCTSGLNHLSKLKNLTALTMRSTLSSDDFQLIGSLVHLTSLDCSGCRRRRFGGFSSNDEWSKEFKHLASLQRLDTLNISVSGINDEDLEFIATVLPPSLKKMNLNGNRSLTDAGVNHLLQKLPQLACFHLGSCPNVSRKMRMDLEANGIKVIEN